MPPVTRTVSVQRDGVRLEASWYDPGLTEPGPAVLVCHGASGSRNQFHSLALCLSRRGLRVLVPDMRGHGASDGQRYHVEIAHWRDDVQRCLDWLGMQPEVAAGRLGAFGFSSGGTAVLEAALLDSRLQALVTLDATVRTVLSRPEALLMRWLARLGRLKRRLLGSDLHLPLYPLARLVPAAVDPIINQAVLRDPDFTASYWRYPLPGAMDSFIVDTLERVADIRIPVCVLHGEEDRIDPPDTARALHECLAGEKALHLIPRSGHMGHLDYSREHIFRLSADWFIRHL